jgi:hypothetical protein
LREERTLDFMALQPGIWNRNEFNFFDRSDMILYDLMGILFGTDMIHYSEKKRKL